MANIIVWNQNQKFLLKMNVKSVSQKKNYKDTIGDMISHY